MRQLFFPLRTSVELFPDPSSPSATARAKEAVVLFDRVVFEAGLFEANITEAGAFATWRGPNALTPSDLEHSRKLPSPGTTMTLLAGAQPARGVPAPPEAMRPLFSAPLARSYVAEWHSGVIEELAKLQPEWAFYTTLPDQGETIRQLDRVIQETRRAIEQSTRDIAMDAEVKAFAQKALARDATVAASMGAAFNVTSLFEPLLAGTDATPEPSGRTALDILVPNVGGLPWEAIAEYREHAGAEEARGKLKEFEDRAMAADPDDPLDFQRQVFREITGALFAAIRDLEGSLGKDLAAEATKTAVSFVPLVGPFCGPGISLAQVVAKEFQEHRTWYAALMKLGAVTEAS